MRVLPLFALLAACSSAEPDILDFVVDPAAGAPGETITASAEVVDFEFSGGDMDMDMDMGSMDMGGMDMDGDDHDHDHDHGDEDSGKGKIPVGHIHLYMDDLQTNPVLMMNTATATFVVPDDATEGTHTLIARLHGSDHLILEPEVLFELEFEVLAGSGATGGTTATTTGGTR